MTSPSVSLLAPLKSSSLVILRVNVDGPCDNPGILPDEVPPEDVPAVALPLAPRDEDELPWPKFEVDAVTKAEVEGNSGLHGEWDPAEVLEEAANGTPLVEYNSWLNYKIKKQEIKKKSISKNKFD